MVYDSCNGELGFCWRLLLEALEEIEFLDQVDGQGQRMMGKIMKKKEDDKAYILAFLSFSSPQIASFLISIYWRGFSPTK